MMENNMEDNMEGQDHLFTDASSRVYRGGRIFKPDGNPRADTRKLDGVTRESVVSDLKPSINEFLWTKLPGRMVLADAEDLAVKIHNMIVAAWDR